MDYESVNYEWQGAVIMARYGPNRTYKVHQIRWDMSADKYTFEQSDEKKVSMIHYFLNTYKAKIMDKGQPLFEIRQKR